MPVEMALDLASLALYDIILYGEHTVLSKTTPTPLRRLPCIMMLSCTSETRAA
jgi:hypothetical protein